MELPIVLAGAGIVVFSLVLSISAERLIRKLNVRPADPSQRSHGARDVAARIDKWHRSRQSRES